MNGLVRNGLRWSVIVLAVVPAVAQSKRGRNYHPLQPAADISVIVEKEANGKRVTNAAVIFRAEREGKNEGSLEVKTNSDGVAHIDVIEVGSHVKVQVIADGYATAAAEFDVPTDTKEYLVKLQKPRAQISAYIDNDGKVSQIKPGVQEPPAVARPVTNADKSLMLNTPGKRVDPNSPVLQLGAKPTDTAPDKSSPTTGSPDSSPNNPVKANPSATGTPAKDMPENQTSPTSVPRPDVPNTNEPPK